MNTQLKLLLFYIIGIKFRYILLVEDSCIQLLRYSNFCQETSTTLKKKSCQTMNSKIRLFILVYTSDIETIGRLCISGLCHRFMPQKPYRMEREIIIPKLYENQWIHLYSKWRIYKTFTVLLHWSSNTNSER